MSQIKITADNLSNIAAKLDAAGANLSVDERGLLASVFQAAALQIHADVQGFSYAGVGAGTPLGAAFGSIFTGPGVESVSAGAAGASATVVSNPGSGAGAGVSVPGVGGAGTYVVV